MNPNLRSVTKEKRELQMMRRLMPATLAAMTKIAFALFCCTLLMLAAVPAWAADQCSEALPLTNPGPIGNPGPVAGCGALITVTGVDGNFNATFFTVTNLGNGNPYDGTEDTLVGVQNNSGANLNSITLSSTTSPIFGFDGDGPCTQNPHSSLCPIPGTTGYEGPNNTFTAISDNKMSGTVTFNTAIPNGGSGWFALEGTPDALTTVKVTLPTPPGMTTLFDFGPFNWKSTPAATTQNGNSLTITAIPVTAGTQINFADGTSGNCITYLNTGGNCRAFDIKCNGPNCDATTYFAEFSTAYDVDHTIVRPGLAKGDPDCSIIPNISTTLFTNKIDSFSQTSKDPTTHGKSGGDGSCWFAVENVSYPIAKLSITKVALPLVKTGTTLPYGIAVLNLGPGTATALTVTDPVPTGTTFQSSAVCFTGTSGITCQSGTNSPCTLTGNVVTCQLGNLLPFSLKTLAAIGIQLNFNVIAGSGTTIANTATANDANNIPNPGINSNQVNTKVCSAIVKGKCIQ
jgi:uncharacterized repeat protein (TIGR01451 family)